MTSVDHPSRWICTSCGYDRTGTPVGRPCPECASTADPVPFRRRTPVARLVFASVLWPGICFSSALIGAAIPLVGAGIAVPFLLTGAVFSIAEPCSTAADEFRACPWDHHRLLRALGIVAAALAANALLGAIALAVTAAIAH
ncbi:MAG: hypothetical protein AMXMBFR58_03660 [Phycisphaerae bacterium]|nr:hypothetical protein [Phycisphaerales bacterium]MCK6477508.1 hypothetical protein [Phycisphaerales bacterium]